MDTSTKTDRILVLGLGNRVMTDDSVGLVALESFRESYTLPQNVDLMDGGTLGLDLLYYMEGYGGVLIVDCIIAGKTPGDVICVEGDEINVVFDRCLSPHQMGIKDLINVLHLQGRIPPKLTVVGIHGKSIDLGTEPEPEVLAGVPDAIEAMARVLGEWGAPVTPIK